jgi:hypothetical protein
MYCDTLSINNFARRFLALFLSQRQPSSAAAVAFLFWCVVHFALNVSDFTASNYMMIDE